MNTGISEDILLQMLKKCNGDFEAVVNRIFEM